MARGNAQPCRRTLSCAYPQWRQVLQTVPTVRFPLTFSLFYSLRAADSIHFNIQLFNYSTIQLSVYIRQGVRVCTSLREFKYVLFPNPNVCFCFPQIKPRLSFSSCLLFFFQGGGEQCVACPAHARCPGGLRVWPTLGYWTPSERLPLNGLLPTVVQRCDSPIQRCQGLTHGTRVCAQCLEGYR